MLERSKYAIVIPFCKKDTRDLIKNLAMWETAERNIADLNETVQAEVDLVLYYATTDQNEDFVAPSIVENANQYQSYFKNILVEYRVLPQARYSYPVGPAVMFFENIKSTPYDCFFYMEPDCLPIRKNWLNHLITCFKRCQEDDVWIRGTIYNGGFRSNDIPTKMHFNGNSVFNVTSPQSKMFFRTVEKKINFRTNYDWDIMRYLNTQAGYEDFRTYLYHIRYSPMVLNFGRQPIPPRYRSGFPPETYFVHGRNYINKFSIPRPKERI